MGGKIAWPQAVDGLPKDLVRKLLVHDRTKRIGNLRNGAEDVKTHKWFNELDWEDVFNKKLKLPFVPNKPIFTLTYLKFGFLLVFN